MGKNGIKNIGILGDGGWGTTLAIHLSKKNHRVKVWGPFSGYIRYIKKTRLNPRYLPGIKIPKDIYFSSKLEHIFDGTVEYVIFAIPSKFMYDVLKKIKVLPYKKIKFLSVTKGIDIRTLLRMSELITEILGKIALAVLSGPTIARELVLGMPTTAVVASKYKKLMKEFQDLLMDDKFRIYTNPDVIGVELGGALKNIIAIACGISDGLGFGTNTKAAILARGLAEITRLGKKLGADSRTFSGLAGLGDLVTTCISPYSRNRFLGEEIGKGKLLKDVLKKMKMTAEGIYTVKSVYRLSLKYKIDMPITKQVYNVLYRNQDPYEAVQRLMSRQRKQEFY